jgi:hypothetical protein
MSLKRTAIVHIQRLMIEHRLISYLFPFFRFTFWEISPPGVRCRRYWYWRVYCCVISIQVAFVTTYRSSFMW